MKFIFDLFPVLLFFAAYKLAGIFTATAVLIAASAAQVGIYWLVTRKFETMHVITLVLVALFGGATLLFHDAAFIQWKPTIISFLFAAGLLGYRYIADKNLIEGFLGSRMELPSEIWDKMNLAWAVYFAVTAATNAFVILSFDTATWVDFHTFGMTAITGSFVIGQTFYLARHLRTTQTETD